MLNKMLCCTFMTLFAFILIGWIGNWTRAMNTGNAAYERGNYEDAQAAFQQAALEKPDNPVAHYNLGTALYRQGKFRSAAPGISGIALKTR